ncbi:hypothetical protein GCM10028796_17460 [Ramlibacter monticola]|nr:hypothetical protein [Ramlibacter monticola]
MSEDFDRSEGPGLLVGPAFWVGGVALLVMWVALAIYCLGAA